MEQQLIRSTSEERRKLLGLSRRRKAEQEEVSLKFQLTRLSSSSDLYLHCVPKKEATKLWAVTLSNLNRF